MDLKHHWERVYATKASNEVSWFQQTPMTSLRLLDAIGFSASS